MDENNNNNNNSNKRPKIETVTVSTYQETTENNNPIDNELLLERAFHHYQDYIQNSEEEEDGEEDIDFLLEILDVLRLVNNTTPKADFKEIMEYITSFTRDTINDNNLLLLKGKGNELSVIKNLKHNYIQTNSLISILKSMTLLQLATYILSTNNNTEEETEKGMEYLISSLEEWMYNPASLSFLANQYRNTNTIDKKQIANLYKMASENASVVRSVCIDILEDEAINEEIKVYIESIVLHSCVGAEYLDEEDEESTLVSYSDVEAISSFLSCMMFSMVKEHDIVKEHLWKFGIKYRLHPNVWNGCYYGHETIHDASLDVPTLYTNGIHESTKNDTMGTIVPEEIYNKLKEIFNPTSLYFQQSNYNQRGYYSFFLPTTQINNQITVNNFIEEMIYTYLVPHIQDKLKDGLVGVEWWVHTRSKSCNLGHQLHFDTDEKSLNSKKKRLLHPTISSVLYLTGGDNAGPTIVFNQKGTDTKENAALGDKLWYNKPINNTFLTFNGDLLHGVLPCLSDNNTDEHRLTLMVGFWTDPTVSSLKTKSKSKEYVYQPANPKLPSINDPQNTWVRQIITSEYPKTISLPTSYKNDTSIVCKCIEPAWEKLANESESDDKNGYPLVIPKIMDHRFFITDEFTFYSSLFEDDDDCE